MPREIRILGKNRSHEYLIGGWTNQPICEKHAKSSNRIISSRFPDKNEKKPLKPPPRLGSWLQTKIKVPTLRNGKLWNHHLDTGSLLAQFFGTTNFHQKTSPYRRIGLSQKVLLSHVHGHLGISEKNRGITGVTTFQLVKENHQWLVVEDDEYESLYWCLLLLGSCLNIRKTSGAHEGSKRFPFIKSRLDLLTVNQRQFAISPLRMTWPKIQAPLSPRKEFSKGPIWVIWNIHKPPNAWNEGRIPAVNYDLFIGWLRMTLLYALPNLKSVGWKKSAVSIFAGSKNKPNFVAHRVTRYVPISIFD